MKAAVVESPNQLIIRNIPEPAMGEYDALCQVLYGSICTGTDQHLIADKFIWKIKYPTILGHESIGRVIAIGPRVRHLKPGDLVTRVGTLPSPTGDFDVNWGGFAEFGIARDHWAMREDQIPPDQWDSFRVNQILPPDIDLAAAPMIITWRETLSYMTRMGIQGGSRVLIIGSGGNAMAFARHAAIAGAAHIAMLGSPDRSGTARQLGVTAFYNYREPDVTAGIEQDGSDGFGFIIDAIGKRGQIDSTLRLLKPGGTIGIYGLDEWGALSIDPMRSRGTFTFYNGGYDEAETHTRVLELIKDGKLDARHWLDVEHPFSLEDIDDAFESLRQKKTLKALIQIAPSG